MSIELNKAGVAFARELIKAGRVVPHAGYHGDAHWHFDADNGDALLGPDGNDWATYGKCHLAVNTDEPEDTKARYKYPFAKKDGGEIRLHVAALHAAASRAARNGAREVYGEAEKLAERIKDEKSASGVVAKGAAAPVVKAPGGGDRTLRFTVTTEAVDRDGDVVIARGLRWDEYLKNPVVLWSHTFNGLPVGKCVGIGLAADGQSVWADIEFAAHPFADEVYKLASGGFLSAVSVGFRILRAGPPDNQVLSRYDASRKCQRVIHEANLLEISLTPIPSNPEALRKAIDAGLVLSKSLREALMPNPIADAFAWIKKTLGWSDDTLAKMTLAEVKGLANVVAKSEPTSDAEDDEVGPDEDDDGDEGEGDGRQEGPKKPAKAKKKGADAPTTKDPKDGDGKPAPAGEEEKCPTCKLPRAECKCRGASPGTPPVQAKDEKGADAPATRAIVLDAVEVKSIDEIVDGVIAAVKAQLPAVVAGIAAPVRELAEAEVARLRGKV